MLPRPASNSQRVSSPPSKSPLGKRSLPSTHAVSGVGVGEGVVVVVEELEDVVD